MLLRLEWVGERWVVVVVGGGNKKKRVFQRPPGRPHNIHMLSDSCLSLFPLLVARERSAGYKRRDPHPLWYPPTHSTSQPPCIAHSPFSQFNSLLRREERRLITVKRLRLFFILLAATVIPAQKERIKCRYQQH